MRPPLVSVAPVFDMIFLFASGSVHVNTFRSPQEFFLHARWLMTGSDVDSEGYLECRCKYCDGSRTQREIDREFQLPARKDTGHHSSRHVGTSSAATSGAIILQAKDYRNLNKQSTG